VILHPLVFFALAVGMNPVVLVCAVFAGRTIKYVAMCELAYRGSSLLKLFGQAAVEAAGSNGESVRSSKAD
jgi:hypothetical protein